MMHKYKKNAELCKKNLLKFEDFGGLIGISAIWAFLAVF